MKHKVVFRLSFQPMVPPSLVVIQSNGNACWILEAILLSFPLLFPSLDELDLGKSHSMDP